MITEVDDALCQLLGQSLPQGTVLRLDPPKPTWQTEPPARMLNLFLFALHEDHVVPTENPVRRMRLSYLVTARAPRVRQEHELLGEALRIALNGELPVGCFGGTLDHGGHPVLLSVADTGPGALWSNLGMPARAAFVLRVSVPVPHVTGREFSRRLRSSG